jgi:hypothetical protein
VTIRRPRKSYSKLVDELGFDPIDAGGLDDSRRQQPGSPVYTHDYGAAGVRRALSQATPQRPPEWSGPKGSPRTSVAPAA